MRLHRRAVLAWTLMLAGGLIPTISRADPQPSKPLFTPPTSTLARLAANDFANPDQEGQAGAAQETVQAAKQAAPDKPKVRRLPTYYTRVVTQKQREEIYQIQADYEVQLEALQEQIKAKLAERDAEIEAVLEPEQLAEVKRLLDEARRRREARLKGDDGGSGSE